MADDAPRTTRRRKTYWQSCVADNDRSKDAIKTWFAPLADEMTPYQADILCDVDTDRELKLRAYMTNPEGRKYAFTRTRGGKRHYTTTMQPLAEESPQT
jgi:hypothetical protein